MNIYGDRTPPYQYGSTKICYEAKYLTPKCVRGRVRMCYVLPYDQLRNYDRS
jgi:hypothetical protein